MIPGVVYTVMHDGTLRGGVPIRSNSETGTARWAQWDNESIDLLPAVRERISQPEFKPTNRHERRKDAKDRRRKW